MRELQFFNVAKADGAGVEQSNTMGACNFFGERGSTLEAI